MKERFPPETERKLLALGNRRYLRKTGKAFQ